MEISILGGLPADCVVSCKETEILRSVVEYEHTSLEVEVPVAVVGGPCGDDVPPVAAECSESRRSESSESDLVRRRTAPAGRRIGLLGSGQNGGYSLPEVSFDESFPYGIGVWLAAQEAPRGSESQEGTNSHDS